MPKVLGNPWNGGLCNSSCFILSLCTGSDFVQIKEQIIKSDVYQRLHTPMEQDPAAMQKCHDELISGIVESNLKHQERILRLFLFFVELRKTESRLYSMLRKTVRKVEIVESAVYHEGVILSLFRF